MRLIRGSPAPFQGYSAQLPICPDRDPCSTLLSPSLSASAEAPLPHLLVGEPVCSLYKGNPGDQKKVKIVLRNDHPRCPLSVKTSPRGILGQGDASGRVKADWEAGEAGADSCSGYVSFRWQAGPGWAWRYPGLSPALRLATGPSEGLHPGLAAAPRPALLALRATL